MTRTVAVGSAPVVFLTKAGQQIVIPLTAVYFESGTKIGTDWPIGPEDAANLAAWLERLHKQRQVIPGKSPPSQPSMIVKAIDTGSWGNDVTVSVEEGTKDGEVDVTAAVTTRYQELTLADVRDVLSSAAASGETLGLVKVDGAASPTDAPAAGKVSRSGQHWTVKSAPPNAKTLLKLETIRQEVKAKDVEITVDDVNGDTGDATFTLVVKWKHTVTGVAASDLPDKLDDLNIAIEVIAPGSDFDKVPAPSQVTLTGGANPQTASATLFSRSSS